MTLNRTLHNLRQTKNSYFNQKNGNPLNVDIIKKGLKIWKNGIYYIDNIGKQRVGRLNITNFNYGKYYGFIFDDETTKIYKINNNVFK